MSDQDDATEEQNQGETQFTSGVVLAIVGTFLFALKSIFIKLAFSAGANPTQLLTLRMLFSLPFYLYVLWTLKPTQGNQRATQRDLVQAFALGFLGYYLASLLDLSGLEYISAQLERLTLFTYPAMIAVLAWLFLGEKFGLRILIAIVLCYVGVMLMFGREAAYADAIDARRGVLLVSGSALCYSAYVLLSKPIMQRIGSRRFTSIAMIGSTLFVSIHFLITERAEDLLGAPAEVYLIGLVLGFVCTVIPSFMINEAIVRIGAGKTSVIGTVGPVLTMFLAIFVLGERSSTEHFLGMAVAVAGVGLVARK